ncbi:pyridoxal phosphate-dependent aminotransferase [Streptomyces hoynatensis]|uniref:Aminotransferase n=2 Tax=Streptomyces hoynatensis TaxID=1141874 RepID=A0A3A9ZEE3_9ACTN|nr:pyridoxal phosphate-dependent aminotransferase [Streptomyces hoynatensis]
MPGRGAVCDHFRMSAASSPASASAAAAPASRVSARVGAIAESATLAVDAKAKALKAAGRPVIGFGAGEPDFPTPGYIVDAAVEACRNPRFHRYTPAGGLPELKEALAAKTLRDSGLAVEPAQVLVTNGGKQAIYEAFAALLDPGDEVIVPAPYWTTYPESIRLAGGVPVAVVADETTGYLTTVEQLEAARTERTKVLLFVSPSNPTGAVYPREQVAAIGRWAAEHGLWVLTDEIYEHLVYGEARFSSLPTVVPEIADRCLVVNGVAKTYAMTGWRVGWLLGPKDVIKAAANLQSHATSNVNNVAQAAALAAVSGDLTAVAEMRTAFDRRRRTIVRMLNEIQGVTCPEPEGAFYAYPSVKGLLGKDIRGRRPRTSLELSALLLEEAEVAVVPGEAFGTPGYLRLSYALGDDDLVEGVSRLQKLLAEAAD